MATVHFVKAATLVDLVTTADPKKTMFLRILSDTELGIGTDPFNPSAVIDLSKEAIVPFSEVAVREPAAPRTARQTGEHWYELKGKRTDCRSLKELLALSLLSIEKAVPGTLEQLTKVKPRSRRIVARDPKDLFDKPHLVKEYSEKLGKDGWYYGTNNSGPETSSWLERACAHAGLTYGTDFKTSLMLTTADFTV